VPDNEDYAALGELLSRVASWSDADARQARSLLTAQEEGIASVHPRDAARRESMTAVAIQLRDALAQWEAER